MQKYIIGRCKGCGNRTAAGMYLDSDHAKETTMEFIESGHRVEILETDKTISIESCIC